MIDPLDQSIKELLNASRDDEENLSPTINDRSFGFHAQQTVEKLLKSLIAAHVQRYKHTHDIKDLVLHVTDLGEHLPMSTARIERLTEYAGAWRYQEPDALPVEDRTEILHTIAALRQYTLKRLYALRPGVDWTS